MYYTEDGKIDKNQLMYSTAKNGLGLISSSFTAGGSSLVSGIGYTAMGTIGLAEDGYMLYEGKNEYGYYENFSGQYMNGSDMAWDITGNVINTGIGVYGLYSLMKTNVASNKNMTIIEEGAKNDYINITYEGAKIPNYSTNATRVEAETTLQQNGFVGKVINKDKNIILYTKSEEKISYAVRDYSKSSGKTLDVFENGKTIKKLD